MNTWLLQHQEVVERLGWTLFHSLWQIVAIALLLRVSRSVFRTSQIRYALAMMALIASLLIPLATFVSMAPARSTARVVAHDKALLNTAVEMETSAQPLPAERRNVPSSKVVPTLVKPTMPWRLRVRQALPWAVAAWFAGLVCIVLRHLASLLALARLRNRGVSPVGEEVLLAFEQVRKRLGLTRMVGLCESVRTTAPMVIGTIKPLILLPCSALTGLSPLELEAILAHEAAHLKRWDDVANFCQCVIEMVIFYHPALWWISRVAREEREHCCDDLAVARGVERQHLAHALGRMALWHTTALQPSMAATGHMPVLNRIKRLLHPNPQPSTMSLWPLLAILVLVAIPLCQSSATANSSRSSTRGRILDRKGIVLAEMDSTGQRFYPYHSLAAHVIGYTGPAKPKSQELVGRSGIEASNDKELVAGEDVTLMLDARMQQIAEKTLAKSAPNGGACVIIDPNNGDLLAMASGPSYDLDRFVPKLNAETYESLLKDPSNPLLPRAYSGEYFPGSTFKLITALAGFQSGALDEQTEFTSPSAVTVGDRVFRNWNPEDEGMMKLDTALLRSSNTWFYQAGRKIGVESMLKTADQMGLGHRTGLPFFEEATGFVPSIEDIKKHSRPDPAPESLAIGQGIKVTVIQAAMTVAAIANGGKLLKPRLLQSQPALSMVSNFSDRGVKPEQLALIKRGMVAVVNAKNGTGTRAAVPGIEVAGKTGTAQWKLYPDRSKSRNLAWFVGFAPADHPRIAFALVYEGAPGEAVTGGGTCGPMVKSLVEQSLAVLGGGPYDMEVPHSKAETDPSTTLTKDLFQLPQWSPMVDSVTVSDRNPFAAMALHDLRTVDKSTTRLPRTSRQLRSPDSDFNMLLFHDRPDRFSKPEDTPTTADEALEAWRRKAGIESHWNQALLKNQ